MLMLAAAQTRSRAETSAYGPWISLFTLDAREKAENGRDPDIWKTHSATWQTTMTMRLSLTWSEC